jgi:hypothetical protein
MVTGRAARRVDRSAEDFLSKRRLARSKSSSPCRDRSSPFRGLSFGVETRWRCRRPRRHGMRPWCWWESAGARTRGDDRQLQGRRLVDVDARSMKSWRRREPPYWDVWRPRHHCALTCTVGQTEPGGGAAQLAWIDQAMDLVTSGAARAGDGTGLRRHRLVEPRRIGLSRAHGVPRRALWRRRGGHGLLGQGLAISLVTTHLPIARVPRALTSQNVAGAVFGPRDWCRVSVRKNRTSSSPGSIRMPGGGLLGNENRRSSCRHRPGAPQARARRIAATVTGPVGAETAIRHARAGHPTPWWRCTTIRRPSP